jgi:hypothetical protein
MNHFEDSMGEIGKAISKGENNTPPIIENMSNPEKIEGAKTLAKLIIEHMETNGEFRDKCPSAYIAWEEMLTSIVDILDEAA